MPQKKRVKPYRIGDPHRRIRKSCRHCRHRGHNHVPGTGNSHRFHGIGSFCATHSTTTRGRKYCTRSGAPKKKRSDWSINKVTGSVQYEGGLPKSRRYVGSSKR